MNSPRLWLTARLNPVVAVRETVKSDLFVTSTFVIKVASRCNLACTYCYMYEHVDQSWRNQPKFMSSSTIQAIGYRLEEYASASGRTRLLVVVHGGEPLLYPRLDYFFEEIRRTVRTCSIQFCIQTNGTLLNSDNLALLKRHSVRIGVSVDGDREVHDRRRINSNGTGSYDQVVKGLRLARATIPDLAKSVLQVIDLTVQPKDALDVLESYGVEYCDFLFPDLNHDTITKSGLQPGDIGEWLVKLFDEWVSREKTLRIRLFLNLIHLLAGGRQGTELLGARSAGALIIETDGSYQIHDALKTTFHGAGHTGLSVRDSPVTVVETLPLAKAFVDKASAASTACLQCKLFQVCGGGYPIHRYSLSRGFDQPSVFCKDLTIIIEHVRKYLSTVNPSLPLAV